MSYNEDDEIIFHGSLEAIKSELLNQIDSESKNSVSEDKLQVTKQNLSENKLQVTKQNISEDNLQVTKKNTNNNEIINNFTSGKIINAKEEKPIENKKAEEKYGDDKVFESWADNNLFFPLATRLIDPLKNIGLTPNMVTYLSTIFTFLSIYYFNLDNRIYATISYLIGYLLDCVDGKMARKYKMTSNYGMAIDLVSDNVSNAVLIGFLIQKYGFDNYYVLFLIFMSYMISISYGLNEAIDSYKTTGNDNFLERKEKQLEKEKDILYDLYLLIIKMSYHSYKSLFPKYNESKLFSWLHILKHFGPGNYCLLVSAILLYIE